MKITTKKINNLFNCKILYNNYKTIIKIIQQFDLYYLLVLKISSYSYIELDRKLIVFCISGFIYVSMEKNLDDIFTNNLFIENKIFKNKNNSSMVRSFYNQSFYVDNFEFDNYYNEYKTNSKLIKKILYVNTLYINYFAMHQNAYFLFIKMRNFLLCAYIDSNYGRDKSKNIYINPEYKFYYNNYPLKQITQVHIIKEIIQQKYFLLYNYI